MSKMFKCEDGTMFPISEVLSVKEATTYYTKDGHEFESKPVQTYSSEKELIDAIPTIVSHPHNKSLFEGLESCVDFLLEGLLALILLSLWYGIWLILWIIGLPLRLFGVKFPGGWPALGILSKAKRERIKEEKNREWSDSCRKRCYKEGWCRDCNYYYYSVKQWDVTLRNQKKKIHIFNSDYEKLCVEMVK